MFLRTLFHRLMPLLKIASDEKNRNLLCLMWAHTHTHTHTHTDTGPVFDDV